MGLSASCSGAVWIALAVVFTGRDVCNCTHVHTHVHTHTRTHTQNERGISPLGIAVGFNRQAAVKVLLERGAEIDRRDPAGNTALHYAAGEFMCACASLRVYVRVRLDRARSVHAVVHGWDGSVLIQTALLP